jgi:hypothetical protein
MGGPSGILHQKGRTLVRHPVTRRWRIKLVGSALAAFCSAVALLAGAAPAGAAQPGGPQGRTLEVTFKISPVAALGATQQPTAAAACAPRFGEFDRTDACWGVTLTFIFLINGRPVGSTVAEVEQSIHLNTGVSRPPVKWTEDDTVLGTVSRGRTAPIEADLVASCDRSCHAAASFRGVIRRGLRGTVKYTERLRVREVNETPTHYKLIWAAVPFAPLNFPKWDSPIKYRCDRNMPGIRGPGCVFPEFTPTLVLSRRQFGASAAMIQWAQKNLSARWGLPGGEPLTRLANSAESDNNNRIICRRAWRPFAPWVAGRVRVPDSCDEFPFAATFQSGALHGVTSGKDCAQVEAVKTSNTGSEATIWNDVRPIGTFSRSAKCVRGHIPLTLNTDLGRDGYLAFIRSQRLLNKDPFWLEVTA